MDGKPTRKIGRSRSALRSFYPSVKVGRMVHLESGLERDFCLLLEYDCNIVRYLEQPVRIHYTLNGEAKHYTPDFLIHYQNPSYLPVLAEIKYRADLRRKWTEYKPTFKAAKQYAQTQGWLFKIYSEVEIQGVYLNNVRFLLPFQRHSSRIKQEYVNMLLEMITAIDETSPEELLLIAFQSEHRRADLLPSLWHLISRGLIGCNLYDKLTMQSPIWALYE